jgi:septation ring formation regulator EzrA
LTVTGRCAFPTLISFESSIGDLARSQIPSRRHRRYRYYLGVQLLNLALQDSDDLFTYLLRGEDNQAYTRLITTIVDLTSHFNQIQGNLLNAQHDLQDAQSDLVKATTNRDAIEAELDQLNDSLAKANKYRDAAKDALDGSQAILQNGIPGVPLQCAP